MSTRIGIHTRAAPHNSISILVANGRRFGLRLRGRAWILADSYQVARLETDLANEILEVRLHLQHEDVYWEPGDPRWCPSLCWIVVSGGKESTVGMDVGAKGSSIATMNVVPLIDILLVLIIIFMVITPLTPKGLDALVPQPAKGEPKPATLVETVVVRVLDTGELKINAEDATWDSLGPRLSDVFKERAEKVAFVQGEDGVRFSDVARAIDIMRSSGVEKVGLMTARLDARQ